MNLPDRCRHLWTHDRYGTRIRVSNDYRALRAAGATLLNEPRPGAGGHLYVFVHPASTGGVLLELIEEDAS